MVGLTFRERMSGPFAMGVSDPYEGASRGRRTQWSMTLHATVTIPDVAEFVAQPSPAAALSGELELPGVREPVPFDDGTFRLFPREDTALMRYELAVKNVAGEDGPLLVSGTKCWLDRPLAYRVWSDTTTLEVRLHRGTDTTGEIVGAGVLRIRLGDFAQVLASLRAPRARTPVQAAHAVGSYAWLFARNLRREYLPRVRR